MTLMHRSRIAAALAVTFATLAAAPALAFDREAWLKDFAQLKAELAAAYANLDWAVESRRMDLPGLADRVEGLLAKAESDGEARRLFESFLAKFGDGHLRIRWPKPEAPAGAAPAGDPAQTAARSCADLGYRRPRDEGLDFSALPRYRKLATPESASFPAGVLETVGGKRLGIVRIALLMEGAFPEVCEQVHPAPAPCDGKCEARIESEVGRRIGAALAAQLAALEKRGVHAIAVDLTANGGGSDWAEAAARIVTTPGLASPRMAFIRHPHWVEQFRMRLEDVERDLARADLPEGARPALEKARAAIRESARVAAEPCDRNAAWEGRATCALVAREPAWHSTGLPETKPRFDVSGLSADHVFYFPARYDPPEGAYRGRLAVLVDGDTASAAELFAATLQDNRRATIIGAPTFGSGCGYTGGGIAIRLANSRARLHLPDCVRLRADGTNEVEGIVPDVLVPWRAGLSRHQRAARALPVLERWAERGGT